MPHTVIADNAGGHLMQRGKVDLCIVGTDRTTATGDVANKIGTYLKALAAARQRRAVLRRAARRRPSTGRSQDGVAAIPIEERCAGRGQPDYRTHRGGPHRGGDDHAGRHAAPRTTAFDVTPARLVTGLITERGVAKASGEGLAALFPEHASK